MSKLIESLRMNLNNKWFRKKYLLSAILKLKSRLSTSTIKILTIINIFMNHFNILWRYLFCWLSFYFVNHLLCWSEEKMFIFVVQFTKMWRRSCNGFICVGLIYVMRKILFLSFNMCPKPMLISALFAAQYLWITAFLRDINGENK